MDGTPDGKIKCTIGNWIGVVYKIPIKELDSCREREELKYSGVYFLPVFSNDLVVNLI